jgi:hypothetical protein
MDTLQWHNGNTYRHKEQSAWREEKAKTRGLVVLEASSPTSRAVIAFTTATYWAAVGTLKHPMMDKEGSS